MRLKIPVRLILVTCLGWMPLSFAQDFPSKPVHIVVPVQGGTMDLLARLIAPVLAVNVTLFDKLPFDPVRDLAPITLAVSAPQFLVVHPSVPVSSVAEFVAYAKGFREPLSYGSIGVGGASHLTMEMFKSAAGLELVHVPYKGSAPAVNDLLAGTVPVAFLVPGTVLPYVKAGRMKVLASTGRRRLASMPGVPTMIESGYADFEAISWIGFLAPARTPRAIVERYNAEIVRILKRPEIREKLVAIDFEVIGSTPEEFGGLIRSEIVRWGEVIRKTGARAN